jgi:hypothetical protein
MSARNGKADPVEEPFYGNGPQNLSPKMLQQALGLTAVLAYQRKVRELSARMRQQEIETER